MASRRGGGGESSNTGLIVALVFFVLATIGLGVGTYMGYSGKADAEKAAKTAQGEKTAAEKAARDERAQKLALLVAAGADQGTDRQTFNGLRGEFGASIQAQVAKLKHLPRWDVATQGDQVPKTYDGLVTDLQGAVTAAAARLKAKEAELAEEQRKAAEQIADLQNRVKTAQDNLKKASDAVVAEQTKRGASFTDDQGKMNQLSEQVKQLTLDKQNLEVDLGRKIKELQTKLDEYQKSRADYSAKIGPILQKLDEVKTQRPELRDLAELQETLMRQFERVQSLANDTPKGQVVNMDRNSGQVYINLGSADYVRQGLTFSVLPAGSTGKAAAGRERKGAVEVVTVMGDHLSTAKVIDATNPLRDPFVRGDLLFNPLWSPSQREHVAIAGIVDLNGDGIDDTPDLVRQLERQGVVVDAYVDLRSRTIKGPGMTEKTTYLILGETPVPPEVLKEDNPVMTAASELLGKIQELKTKARDVGAEQVQYRRFLAMIGYKLPKQTQSPQHYSAMPYLQGAGGTPKGPDSGGGGKDNGPPK